MKKVVLASLLACVAIAWGLPSALAQSDGAAAPPAAGGQVQMPADEYAMYNNAITQTDPKAKAAAIEAYLAKYPQSAVKLDMLILLMDAYQHAGDATKLLEAADQVLQLDPNNLRALTFEAALRKSSADALTDAAAKQAGLDAAAGYAQKGLAAAKPAAMSDADFKKLQDAAFPFFYSTIAAAAMNKNDFATAIDNYKKELASVPVADTENPAKQLQDTYYLAFAYYKSTPPDYLDCAFYMARFVAFAPEPYKSQAETTAKYCYNKYHGAPDGYEAFAAAAQANLNPPAGLFASVKPAPTPADIINNILNTTPDLATLAPGDKEYILQNGTPDQAQKVWDSIKGKSLQFPNVLVISSTPEQVKVAISEDAVQSKTADFTFNMTPPEPVPELKEHATPAERAAYKKKVAAAQKQADAIAAATAPGQTVTLSGTFDSYTPKPIMITMTDGQVILPEATKPAPKAAAHHTTAKKQ